jgi:hypothetical protein
MCSDDNLDAMADEVEELTNALKVSLDVIQQGTKMPFGEDPVTPAANASSDPYSIHFIPADSATKRSYSQLLNYELKLRNLSVLGTFTERRERLRNELQSEKKLRELLVRLNHSKRDANALFLLIQTLPCILHMENRMGIKIITMLFVKGLSSAMKKELYGDVPSEASRIDKYFETIQSIVNKNILGSELSPAHWKCPTAAKGKEIGTITMDNGKTRKIIDSLELLIDASIVDNAEKTQWKECIPFYRSAVTRLRSKEDFDTEAIVRFQQDADKFFQMWVTLHGIEGITNYIHMLSSGHMSVYLARWKNLYRYSQQGWEAFNSLLKTFFFRRTGRGGATNRGRGRKSRLLPIGRWLQRRIVWLCGHSEAVVDAFIANNPTAKRSADAEASNVDGEEDDDIHDS